VLVTEKGQANVFQGILTKEDVLSVSDQEPTSTADIHRIIGSGFLDRIKSVSSKKKSRQTGETKTLRFLVF
jgi:hypothetical protein